MGKKASAMNHSSNTRLHVPHLVHTKIRKKTVAKAQNVLRKTYNAEIQFKPKTPHENNVELIW